MAFIDHDYYQWHSKKLVREQSKGEKSQNMINKWQTYK